MNGKVNDMQMFSQLQDESDQLMDAKNATLADEQHTEAELGKLEAVWVYPEDPRSEFS
jgi:hypothetical protein